MTRRVHIISDKDTENKTGNCANCGRVEIRQKKNYWICMPGARENKERARQKRLYGQTATNRPNECSVCGNSGTICYDHDHKTGKFRGWLCSPCNLALGYAYDNPRILRKLAEYIERANDATVNST